MSNLNQSFLVFLLLFYCFTPGIIIKGAMGVIRASSMFHNILIIVLK